MSFVGKMIVALALLLASPLAHGEAAAPAKTGGGNAKVKIGVGTLGPSGLPADLRIRLEDATASGLTASGAAVVTATDLGKVRQNGGLGACTDPVCERRLAQITDIQYWLRGVCLVDLSTYRLHLELVDAASGAVVAARDDTCDICTEADVGETASMAASALKATLPNGPSAPITATPGPAAPPLVTAPGSPSAVDRASRRPTWLRALPWVAFAGAAVAGGIGAYYLSQNNKHPDRYRINDTIWVDVVPAFGVSALLITTGIVLLALPDRRDDAQPTKIVVSWDHVGVVGRF